MAVGRNVDCHHGQRHIVPTNDYWIGHHEDALPLLSSAYQGSSSNVGRALNACCLALTHAALGDKAQASKWLVLALQHDPDSYLLAEATAAVSAMP